MSQKIVDEKKYIKSKETTVTLFSLPEIKYGPLYEFQNWPNQLKIMFLTINQLVVLTDHESVTRQRLTVQKIT